MEYRSKISPFIQFEWDHDALALKSGLQVTAGSKRVAYSRQDAAVPDVIGFAVSAAAERLPFHVS